MALKLTVSDQNTIKRWAEARIDTPVHFPEAAEAMAVLDEDNKIVAAMVIDGFFGDAAMLHFASDGRKRWASRNILGGLFGYIFFYKGLNRALMLIPRHRTPAIKAALDLGFYFEGAHRASPDNGAQDVFLSMFASECRWIKASEGDDDGQT